MHHIHRTTIATLVLIIVCIGVAGLALSIGPAQAAEDVRPAQQQADMYEPNDTAQSARFLPPSGTSALTFFTNNPPTSTASVADDDWFLLYLDPNRSIVITSTALVGGGGGSLIIEGFSDANGTILAGFTSGPGSVSAVTFVNNMPFQMQYRVRVRNLLGMSAPSYGYRLDYVVAVLSSPTPTPVGANPDPYEPNHLPSQSLDFRRSYINVGSTLSSLNFFTYTVFGTRDQGDVDWYFFYAKKSSYQGGTGGCYRVTTSVQPGVDTQIFVYRGDQAPADNAFTTIGLLASNDDVAVGRRESQATFGVPYDGLFWIKVWNLDPIPRGAGQAYTLSLSELPLHPMRSQSRENDPCGGITNTYLPVQVRNSSTMLQPTPTVTSAQPLQPGSQLLAGTVQVITVMMNGNPGLNEADEYVELKNVGQTPAYLDGWKLRAIRNADNVVLDEYTFPGGAVIAANQTCRIYTNLPFGAENCGFAGGFANDQPLWPPNGARAVLLNPQGQEMARFVY